MEEVISQQAASHFKVVFYEAVAHCPASAGMSKQCQMFDSLLHTRQEAKDSRKESVRPGNCYRSQSQDYYYGALFG